MPSRTPVSVIVDQAVIQLYCSARLSWACYVYLVPSKLFRHNCSTIARHYDVYPGENSGFKSRK